MTKLCLLNFILLQWFCIRLARVMGYNQHNMKENYHQVGWKIFYVLPLTGWWSKYIYWRK